jgi:hypothetical protein
MFGQLWKSSEGDQHFKGNASHVLHACCHAWVTLVLKRVEFELLKLIQIFQFVKILL